MVPTRRPIPPVLATASSDLLEILRGLSGQTPILVVSSITASDYVSSFPTDEDNLIDNFLSKPVEPQKLVAEVSRLLKRR